MKYLKILIIVLCLGVTARAQNILAIPDTLSGGIYQLNLHEDKVQFFPGHITNTYGFNSHSYLGPTLIFKKGQTANITVVNSLKDTTTIHWHGLHVAPKNDGGPHTIILPGATWNPVFTVMNKAATYWYHPHMHKETGKQAMRGAAGMIIVRDDDEAALPLPRRYGLDDFPVIVQSQEFDSLNQVDYRGMEDSILLVNGTLKPYLNIPAQVVRFRLLNAAQERNFNFGFTKNQPFYVIGNDGGLLQYPVKVTRIRLAPGERAEVLLDISGMQGQTINLMSYASEIPVGVQGGPTMPMPKGSPPMDSRLNGIDFNILQLKIKPPTADPITSVPKSLVTYQALKESDAKSFRNIDFTADNDSVMDGPFYFNKKSFEMMRIDYRIPLGNTEIWTLRNLTMVAHPFHIHDVQFFILDRDGSATAPEEKGSKDVVLVAPNETVRFITKFEDFADTTVPYMFHCHVLMHEDDGMMGQFLVVPANSSIQNAQMQKNNGVSLYPNPVLNGEINLHFGNLTNVRAYYTVYNLLGQAIISDFGWIEQQSLKIKASGINKGKYIVKLVVADQIYYSEFVK